VVQKEKQKRARAKSGLVEARRKHVVKEKEANFPFNPDYNPYTNN